MLSKIKNFFFGSSKQEEKPNYIVISEGESKSFWYEDEPFKVNPIRVEKRIRTLKDLVDLYGSLAWVYAGIRTIADAFSLLKFKIVKRANVDDELRWVEVDHPIIDLLENPNPEMSFCDLMEATIIALESTGNAYWEIVTDSSGRPVEIYPLLSHLVEPVIDNKKKKLVGYLYRVTINGQPKDIKFDLDEVVHFKYYNPLSDIQGHPKLLAAQKTIFVEKSAQEHLESFFENGAVPGGVLMTDYRLTDQDYQRILRRWEQAHRGSKKHYRVAILEQGMQYKDIAINIRDAEMINIKKLDREEILGVLGVPLSMVGLREGANYATMQFERRVFWEDTILPKAEKVAAVINRKLIPRFKVKKVKFIFDYNHIGALRESLETRARVARMLTDGGILTINEVRRELFNKPKVEWGDTWFQPLNLAPVTSGRKPENPGGRKPGLDNTKPKALFDTSSYLSYREGWVEKIKLILKDVFEEQRLRVKEIVDAYVPSTLATKSDYMSLLPVLEREIERAVFSFDNVIADEASIYLTSLILHAGNETMIHLYKRGKTKTMTFRPDDQELKDLVDDWVMVFAEEVNYTTLKRIKDALVADDLVNDPTYTKVQNAVHNVFEDILNDLKQTQSRIEKMSWTEFNAGWNCGVWLALKQAGIKEKVWKCSSDNPRPSHKLLCGKSIDVDGKFKVGDGKARFPGDWYLPPEERINCYCYLDCKEA